MPVFRKQGKVAFPAKKYRKQVSYNRYWDAQDGTLFRTRRPKPPEGGQEPHGEEAAPLRREKATRVHTGASEPKAVLIEPKPVRLAAPKPAREPKSERPAAKTREAAETLLTKLPRPKRGKPVRVRSEKSGFPWKWVGFGIGVCAVVAAALVLLLVLPNTPERLVARADSQLEAGDAEAACETYLLALEKKPDDVDTILTVADLYIAAGKPNDAISFLEGLTVQDEAIAAMLAALVPTVTWDLDAGTYDSIRTVRIESAREDVTIYYTRDGSDPTVSSAVYSKPVGLPVGQTTVRVLPVAADGAHGKVEERIYIVKLRQPDPIAATPTPGAYAEEQLILLTTSEGDTVFYTLDGTDPTVSSNRYAAPTNLEAVAEAAAMIQAGGDAEPVEPDGGIVVDSGLVEIRAIAVTPQGAVSEVASFSYDLSDVKPRPVTFDLPGGSYVGEQVLHLSAAREDYVIYYAVYGYDPDPGSEFTREYDGEIKVVVGYDGPIRAIAVNADGVASDVVSVDYTISSDTVETARTQTPAPTEPESGGTEGEGDFGAAGTSTGSSGLSAGSSAGKNIGTTTVSSAAYDCAVLCNRLRANLGLRELTISDSLMAAANQRAYEMVANNKYSHTRPDGRKWNTAALDAGYSQYAKTCENIAMVSFPVPNTSGYTFESTTAGSHWFNKWFNSSAHYVNMTRTNLTTLGVGIAYRCDNGVYTVMASMLLL